MIMISMMMEEQEMVSRTWSLIPGRCFCLKVVVNCVFVYVLVSQLVSWLVS